ncbi:MAG: C39 family peptidase [Microgenomates group bacterium]
MENSFKKEFFVVILGILIFILFLLILTTKLLSFKKNKDSQKNLTPIPTSFFYLPNNKFNKKDQNQKPTPTLTIPVQSTGVKEEEIPKDVVDDANQSFNLRNRLPLENEYFQINYDYKKDNFVVFLKNNTSEVFFFQWLEKNYPGIKRERFKFSSKPFENISPTFFLTPTKIILENESNTQFKLLVDLLKIIFSQNPQTSSPSFTPSGVNIPSQSLSRPFDLNITPPQTINNYIYFSQSCYGINSQYCQLPLPGGCTLSQAGCGPTTITMIIANLTNYKNITPAEIVKQYTPGELGCRGSGYTKAKQILEKYGLRTGSLIFSYPYRQGKTVEHVINQLKNYQKSGATFFTLAAFKQRNGNYIGHYFWIINIDDKNNIWTLDPYYGRNSIPYNQNTRYPDPLYELSFPVYKD